MWENSLRVLRGVHKGRAGIFYKVSQHLEANVDDVLPDRLAAGGCDTAGGGGGSCVI